MSQEIIAKVACHLATLSCSLTDEPLQGSPFSLTTDCQYLRRDKATSILIVDEKVTLWLTAHCMMTREICDKIIVLSIVPHVPQSLSSSCNPVRTCKVRSCWGVWIVKPQLFPILMGELLIACSLGSLPIGVPVRLRQSSCDEAQYAGWLGD